MAKGKKTGGKDWVPGVCVNPSGRPKLPDDIKKIRVLTNEHLKVVGDLLLFGNRDALNDLLKNANSDLLDVWIASVIHKGIRNGDMSALNELLNRLIGKVTEKIEHKGISLTIIEKLDGSQTILGAEIVGDEK